MKSSIFLQKRIVFMAVCLFFGVFFSGNLKAQAATIYSNSSTGNDSAGDGSFGNPYKTFHKAYTMATNGDTLNLTGTFDWSNADETGDVASTGYTVAKSLTIQGQGATETIIQADTTPYTADRRIFTISSATTIQDLTIRHGYAGSTPAAIYAANVNLTILRTIVTLNRSSLTYQDGSNGAIRYSGNSGIFVMRNCLVSENGNMSGYNNYTGGIYINSRNIANEITNSTFYHNSGAYNGALLVDGYITITNSTFIGNRGTVSGSDVFVFSTGAKAYVKNNIFADKSGVANLVAESGGVFIDGGYNIIETQTGAGFVNGVNGNLVGEQASLNIDSVLAENGAENGISTLALLEGSVAINAGDPADGANNGIAIPSSDQRGFYRPDTTDIGAYEYNGTTTVEEPTSQASEVNFSDVLPAQMTVSWTNGNGARRIVFVKQASSGTATPVDQTTYTANATFGSGTQIGETGWYAVYKGTGTSVILIGLNPGTDYITQVFEYDGGSGMEDYLTGTASNNPATQASMTVSEPTVQAHSLSFTSVEYTTMDLSWTNGDGANRAVFIKQANSGTALPVDQTTYTANTAFGSGTQIGTSGWYCVYNSTGSSVSLTGLTAQTDYIAQVFEYNGPAGYEDYLVDSAADNPKVQTSATVEEPATQAHSIIFSSVGYTSMTASWTNGDGAKRAVFAKQASEGTAEPIDDTTYTASAIFGSGTQIGETGWHTVYDGTGTSVGITGLTVGTDYIFQVFEYNESGVIKNYNIASTTDNPMAQSTLAVSEPTTQASEVVFSSVGATGMTIGWTNGNGENRAVFVKTASSGSADPVDSVTYTASTAFGSGTQIGSTGWYNVYNGTSNSVSVTGLSLSTPYRVQVFEYNGGVGMEDYLTGTASNNPNNQTTTSRSDGEDFETGDFSNFEWTLSGTATNYQWTVTSGDKNNGTYSAKAGAFTETSRTSILQVTLDVLEAGNISFYKKVSSESGCDYLRFYIDGVQPPSSTWSGSVAWSQNTYAVTAGSRTFKWEYSKDYSVNSGSDTAWIDDIVFPTINPTTYSLQYATGGHGSISGNEYQVVNEGENGTEIEAIPDSGYHFVNWSDDSTDNPRTDINVIENISVSANFAIDTYTLTYTAGANGSITGSSPQTVNYGADGSAVTAVPNSNYHFVNWSDDSTDNPRTDTSVGADISVTANFAINTYTLTYTAGDNGSISGDSPQTVDYGSNGSAVEAVPDSGYLFSSWSDASEENPRTDTSIAENISVTASFVVADADDPVLSSITAYTSSSGVIITWATNEDSSALVNYGLTNSTSVATSESDTSPRDTDHSVTISDLVSCTRYYYKAQSTDGYTNTGYGSVGTFKTTGCTGDSTITATGQDTITTASGGSLTQGNITLTIPVSFTSSAESVVFQANQLDNTNFSATAGAPSGLSQIGTDVYTLRGLTDENTNISSFDTAITIAMDYSDSDITTLEESSLWIYRYDGSNWNALADCVVDTSANTVTCTTTSFSDFAIFGEGIENESENEDNNYDDLDIKKLKYKIIGENQIRITFKTNNKAQGKVKYGTSKNKLTKKEKGSKNKKNHTINLKNLTLGKKYYFRALAEDIYGQEERTKIYSIVISGNKDPKSETHDLQPATQNSGSEVSSYSGNATPNSCSYVVESGDSLWSIAKKIYGDATAYPKIIERNKSEYPDIESKLSIGQELNFCDSNQAQQMQLQPQAQNTAPQPEIKNFRWWNPVDWFR